MEVFDSQVEILLVAVAVGIALEGADLVVHRLQWPGADAVIVPVEQRELEQTKLRGRRLEDRHFGGLGAVAPVLPKALGGLFGHLFPEVSKFLLHVVGHHQRFIDCQQRNRTGPRPEA